MKRAFIATQLSVLIMAGMFIVVLKASPLFVVASLAFMEFCSLLGMWFARRVGAKLESLPLARR